MRSRPNKLMGLPYRQLPESPVPSPVSRVPIVPQMNYNRV
jgi:hypothetical protein